MYKVIIVDDEEVIQKGLSNLIDWNELNMEVVGFASNGLRAMELISKLNPDIMICDIKMPVMDGIALLRGLYENKSVMNTIILSGYDDFKYVKEALKYKVENYLLKPVDKDELISTLLTLSDKLDKDSRWAFDERDSVNILRATILNRLVTRQIDEEELMDKLDFFQVRLAKPPFHTAIIKIIGVGYENNQVELEKKYMKVEKVIQNILQKSHAGYCFQMIVGSLILLVDGGVSESSCLSALMEECLKSAAAISGHEVLVGVGRPVSTITETSVSYEDAVRLMDYIHIHVKNKILYYEEEIKKSRVEKSEEWDFDVFEEYIQGQKLEDAYRFIDQVSSDCAKMNNMGSTEIKNSFISLVTSCFNVARRMKIDIKPLLSLQAPFDKVLINEADQKLPDWIKMFVTNITDQISLKKQKTKPQTVDVLEYINKNYNKDLSLKLLSNEFGLTSAYLGLLIKTETGEVFSKYLNKLRIEEAKELLISKRASAGEISRLVGFWDSGYFYKVFKKYTGCYPTEYRSQK